MLFLEWTTLADGLPERAQSTAAHELLSHMLAALGVKDEGLVCDARGRPFLPHAPYVDFNLSHTNGLAACAVEILDLSHAQNEKETDSCGARTRPRVGVDVEALPRDLAGAERLAARFFAPAERAYFAAAENKPLAFAEIFTAKEAFAKFVGDGLSQHTKNTDTKAPLFCETHGIVFETRYFQETAHVLTLCKRGESGLSRKIDK